VCATSALLRPVIGLLLGLALIFLIVDVGPRWQTTSAAWATRGIPASGAVSSCVAHDHGAPPVPVPQPSPRTDSGDHAVVASCATTALTHALDSTPPVQLQSDTPTPVCCLISTGTSAPRGTETRVYTSRAPPASSPAS